MPIPNKSAMTMLILRILATFLFLPFCFHFFLLIDVKYDASLRIRAGFVKQKGL